MGINLRWLFMALVTFAAGVFAGPLTQRTVALMVFLLLFCVAFVELGEDQEREL